MIRTVLRVFLVLLLAVSPQAFAKSKLMAPAANQAPTPEPGKALVVFMRPSSYGGMISSTVYDAPDDSTTFLGALEMKDKFAVQMTPGAHRLMVIGENADFIDANLEAGKTYYVVVRVRMGMMKARFSLVPIHNGDEGEIQLDSAQFKEWAAVTRTFIEKKPEADAWFEENKGSIEKKKAGYLEKWNRMLPVDRAVLVLHAEDGVVTP